MKLATRTLKRDDWKITSPFGSRTHPITKKVHFHSGIDFGTRLENWGVYALEDGFVVASNSDATNGNYIWVVYPRIDLKIFYCHLLVRNVVKGQSVNEHTLLGKVGTTGTSTAIHLHMGVKNISTDKYFDYKDYDYIPQTVVIEVEEQPIVVEEPAVQELKQKSGRSALRGVEEMK